MTQEAINRNQIFVVLDQNNQPKRNNFGWPFTYSYEEARKFWFERYDSTPFDKVTLPVTHCKATVEYQEDGHPRKLDCNYSPGAVLASFDDEGQIKYYDSMMFGVPYVKQSQSQYGKTCRLWGTYCWVREKEICVSKEDALELCPVEVGGKQPEGRYYGKVLLKESLTYAPQSHHEPKLFRDYRLCIHPESILVKEHSAYGSAGEFTYDDLKELL